MQVPFFDLQRLYLQQHEEIADAISQVLKSGHYILGDQVSTFEARLKSQLFKNGDGKVATCNSGTDALILALLASGIRSGDEVVTVSHTAIPTITAIRAAGATPTFVDVDSDTWLLDVSKLESAITPQTKAIITVHLYGNMVPVPLIDNMLKNIGRKDIVVIEDVAQAQGASLQAKQAGTLGRFGALSFYPTKNLGALGDGGAVICQSEADYEVIRQLRNYGQKDRYFASLDRGINSRLDEIQAAVLKIRLQSLTQWNQEKIAMMNRYQTQLDKLPIRFQKVSESCHPAWHLCVIALETETLRNDLMKYLNENQIQTLIHYPHPTHRQSAFQTDKTVSLPTTESLATRILSIPMNVTVTELEQMYIIEKIKSFFR